MTTSEKSPLTHEAELNDAAATELAPEEPGLAVVLPLSRQMRRAEERNAAKEAERREQQLDAMTADDPRLKPLLKARHMLFAVIRETGRIRIKAEHLNRVTVEDKLDVKVQPNGDLMVTYLGSGG